MTDALAIAKELLDWVNREPRDLPMTLSADRIRTLAEAHIAERAERDDPREAFITSYMARSGIGEDRRISGFKMGDWITFAVPCDCGDEICQGWKMVSTYTGAADRFFKEAFQLQASLTAAESRIKELEGDGEAVALGWDGFKTACETIISHDQRIARINKYLSDDDAENGDGFFAGLPGTSVMLRRISMRLLAASMGLKMENSIIEYFFDECLSMDGGGRQTYPDGTTFKLDSIGDLWRAVQYERQHP